jgi:uncharacterized membrane protein YwzB
MTKDEAQSRDSRDRWTFYEAVKRLGKDGNFVNITNLVIVIVILLLPLVFTFWAIRDVAYGQFPTPKTKYIWFAVVTLFPVLGALVYLVVGRSQRRAMPTSS